MSAFSDGEAVKYAGGNGAISVGSGGISGEGGAAVPISGPLTVTAGFGCNGATAQAAFISGGAAPAGGVGAAAGAYDTAAHRDAAITLLNNIRSALVANGIMS